MLSSSLSVSNTPETIIRINTDADNSSDDNSKTRGTHRNLEKYYVDLETDYAKNAFHDQKKQESTDRQDICLFTTCV